MANTFLKAEKIAATALGLLERELVLSQLVWTNHGFDFTGAKNDTITVRVPARMSAREYDWRNDRTDAIVTDTLAEDSLTVQLSHDYYTAVAVTDEEMTLDIADFGQQILMPQVRAVADKLDSGVASMITGATYPTAGQITDMSETDPWLAVVKARAVLNKNNVDRNGRILLVGSDVETALITSDRLADVSQSGSDGALRDATIGRVAGFTVVSSSAIPDDEAYAFVPSAFALCTRAPIVPAGVPFGQSTSYAGYAMRWIRDYDPAHLQDRSVVNAYVGYNVMLDQDTPGVPDTTKTLQRAVKLKLDPGTAG